MNENRGKIVAGIGVFLLLLLVLGLFTGQAPEPDQAIPNINGIIGSFRAAKDSSEGLAGVAKTKLRKRQLGNGPDLYVAARAAHGSAISRVISALEQPAGTISETELRSMLTSANSERKAFENWYYTQVRGSTGPSYGEGPVSSSSELFGEIADVVLKLAKLQDERAAEQRRILREQLEECRWVTWDQAR